MKGKILAILLTLQLCPINAVFKCPFTSRGPCTCAYFKNPEQGPRGELTCSGLPVSQEGLNEFMTALKEGNTDTVLQIEKFNFKSTGLETLDLSPLTKCRIVQLNLLKNSGLGTIVRYTGSEKLSIKEIMVSETPLSNEAVDNLLSYFDPQSGFPETLQVMGGVKNVERGKPLIPSLASYTKIKSLELQKNSFETLGQGAIKGLRSLENLNLDTNNILRLEKGFLDLGSTKDSPGLKMYLRGNELDTLTEEVWKELLSPKGPIKFLDVQKNQFVCNDTMRWIKSKTITAKVDFADCVNDKGYDIFTTQKVGDAGAMGMEGSMSFCLIILLNFWFFL